MIFRVIHISYLSVNWPINVLVVGGPFFEVSTCSEDKLLPAVISYHQCSDLSSVSDQCMD